MRVRVRLAEGWSCSTEGDAEVGDRGGAGKPGRGGRGIVGGGVGIPLDHLPDIEPERSTFRLIGRTRSCFEFSETSLQCLNQFRLIFN